MKKFIFVTVLVAGTVAFAADPNPYVDYEKGMADENGDPNAVEWQDDNRDQIEASTSEEIIAAIVKDEISATRLLTQLRGAYSSNPRAMTQIAAVTSWVMGEEPCWFCFWKPSPAAGRRIWVATLEKKLRMSSDEYVKTVCRQQLDRCGYEADCPLVGSWALFLGKEPLQAGHLSIQRSENGVFSGTMLMYGSSPVACTSITYENGHFSAIRPGFVVEGDIVGDAADCVMIWKDDKTCEIKRGPLKFRAVRNPPIDPSATVKGAKFGEPIDLLKDGLDGFLPMAKEDGEFGWSFKDGVLSNRVRQKDTTYHGRGINIVTKRADFYDFKIEYDVSVPKKANSGVYLRGRYELQVKDSYGMKVDCHNMAALYGRITPSVAAEKPAGEWQHVEAILCNRHLTVILNGVTIIDDQPVEGITGGAIDANEFVPGPIYIQGDHTDADYRNMILTPCVN